MNEEPIILNFNPKSRSVHRNYYIKDSTVYFGVNMKFEKLGNILPDCPELTVYLISWYRGHIGRADGQWIGRRCFEEEYFRCLTETFSMDYVLEVPNDFYELERTKYLVEQELVR